MEATDITNINDIINTSLQRAISYKEFREEVEGFVQNNSTSGNEKTDALINYTALNDRRMKRWDKTLKISEEIVQKIKAIDTKVTWLVLTESWCGDAAHIMPVINKVAELNHNISFKIVYRDENDDLMQEFLTNGGKAIPKLIMLDNSNEVKGTFGPRPEVATKMVKAYKEEHGKLTPEFKEDLQRWYNKDKGVSTIKDLEELLMNL